MTTKIDGYELKPCPFCGGEKLRIFCVADRKPPIYFVDCECGGEGPWDLSQIGAIEKWNFASRLCNELP